MAITERMVGWPVYSQDGQELGTVKEVRDQAFKVNTRMAPDYWLPADLVGPASADRVTLTVDRDRVDEYKSTDPDALATTSETTTTSRPAAADTERMTTTERTAQPTARTEREGTEGRDRLQLREEQLRPETQTVEAGQVGITKEVVTEQQTVDVPVRREEVVIDRHPVDRRPADSPIGEGETVSVPVNAERATLEKETVVSEELNVGRREVQDTERVSGEVRREEARVVQEGDVDVRGADDTRRTERDTPPR